MIDQVIRKLTAAAVLAASALITPAVIPGGAATLLPVASAACPQAELIFARGRIEPPGAGQIGNALISQLRSKTGKNIDLYAVQYPADTEIDEGANDMSQRVQYMAANCPDTRLVQIGRAHV